MPTAPRCRPELSVLAAALGALLLLLVQPAGAALAATFVVTQTADAADPTPGDGVCDVDPATIGNQCSLRAAVQTANAVGGSHTVRLPDGTYPLSVGTRGEEAAAGGDLDITADVTIRPASGTPGGVTIDANDLDRIFDVKGGASLTLVGLTVTDGDSGSDSGGAIQSAGTLTLLNVTVSDSRAGGFAGGINLVGGTATLTATIVTGNRSDFSGGFGGGGGILVDTTATLTGNNLVVSGNQAAQRGGGIFTLGTVTLADSTVADNTATSGGIHQEGGSLTLASVTLSGNSANLGGGLSVQQIAPVTATLTNVTISGNSAFAGGGLFVDGISQPATVTLTNVTVGPNTATGDPSTAGVRVSGPTATVTARDTLFESACATAFSGTLTDGGGNVRDTTDAPGCPGTANEAISTTLGPLQDNGGFTQTHALLAMSPAIGAGTNATCAATDQRGVPRALTVGDPCDAGAFEVRTGTFPPVVLDIPDQTIDEDGATGPLALRFADTNAVSTGSNTVTITRSGPAALLPPTIVQGGMYPNRTISVQPPPDVNGGPLTVQVEVQATGGGSPTTVSFDVNVNAVNDAPQFTLGAGPTIGEDAGPQSVPGFASGMAVGPPTAVAFDEGGQTLTGFTTTVTGTTGWLTFTTAPTLASNGTLTYQAAANSNGTATVSVTLSDNGGTANGGQPISPPQTFTITVNAVPDPPTVTTTVAPLAYTENHGAVAIDPGLTVTDADSLNLAGATVSITGSFQSGQDVLAFTNTAAITGSLNVAGDTLTLTGATTVANYQAALQSVTYTNTSENPITATRTVSFRVTDDTATASTVATRQITVAVGNDPPVNTVPPGQSTPGNTPRVFSAANLNAIVIADPDAGTADVQTTLSVTSGTLTVGAAGTVPPLTSVVGNGTATLVLTGTTAEITAALDGLSYTPPNGFTGMATLTVTTNDLGNTPPPAQQDQDTVQIAVGQLPTVSVNDPAAVAEGDAAPLNSILFTVTLAAPSDLQVTVPFTIADQTATGGPACAAGIDFQNTGGTVTFVPTDTSETITVPLCGDTVAEGNETLAVNLGTPTNATVADGAGTGTIADDDLAGTIAFTSATAQVGESSGSVTLTVQRTGPGIVASSPTGASPSSAAPAGNVPAGSVRPNLAPSPPAASAPVGPAALSPVTVQYATANGTATAGQDYTTTSGTLSFGVGETTKTIAVPILSDSVDEPPETFTVTLSSPTGGATLGPTSTATVTIADADTTPCQTVLTAAVPAGANVLPVQSQAGCSVGDTVAIDPGQPNEERGLIIGFGSIVIQQPTTQAHAAGAVVVRVTAGPPAAVFNSPGDDSADDERVERERETEEERRQRARTNQGNKDDDSAEGDVIETRCDQPWPSVVIANRDGAVEVKLLKEAQSACASIQVGDYLEADGEKQHEQLFHADSVEVKRRR